ncbi:PD-(D/E)XK nuclease family protein [Janibacter terrae]|uniref:PD-(D/E)XK nuclease family protein n=1 Tax=Janibacter terrae TaxID=103817 RepID=A0ABZ2FFG3_9MICO
MNRGDDLITRLVPILGRAKEPRFNVFDVMHHGLHEKQVSNVFSWLLRSEETHGLGDRFVKIFVDEINLRRGSEPPLPHERYAVIQEVNTSIGGDDPDIADIVLEGRSAAIVVENYFTSDGHGHSYGRYKAHSELDGRLGAVVLLSGRHDPSLQTGGWEEASVLTYAVLVSRLIEEIDGDSSYATQHPEAHAFIHQMHQKFVKRRAEMEGRDVLDFVVAMCDSGEVRRYQMQRQDVAAEQFAGDVAEQARARFGEGRDLLHNIKARLRNYSAEVLKDQLNTTFGEERVRGVNARYSGMYQWTINFEMAETAENLPEARLQIKFGPSAWHANEADAFWKNGVAREAADYSRLFLTHAPLAEVKQSSVSLQEVLDGLDPADRRLHDEIMLWFDPSDVQPLAVSEARG